MQDADQFLMNDVGVSVPTSRKVLFPGQEFVHELDLSSHRFKTQRKINAIGGAISRQTTV